MGNPTPEQVKQAQKIIDELGKRDPKELSKRELTLLSAAYITVESYENQK